MKRNWLWLVVLVMIAGAAVYLFYPRPVEPPVAEVTMQPIVRPVPEPEPRIRYPLPPPQVEPEQEAEAEPVAAPEPLPALDDSDSLLQRLLSDALGGQSFDFVFEGLIRRLVVTVDNLPREQVAQRFLPVRSVGGTLRTDGEDESLRLSEANYARYDRHVAVLQKADTTRLVQLYVRHYPLFQQAYEELGYPDAYFNDRLMEVIDHLLAARPVPGEVALVQPSVMYRYADPALEARSAGEKTLLRMGPAHMAAVQAKLGELRAELLAQVVDE